MQTFFTVSEIAGRIGGGVDYRRAKYLVNVAKQQGLIRGERVNNRLTSYSEAEVDNVLALAELVDDGLTVKDAGQALRARVDQASALLSRSATTDGGLSIRPAPEARGVRWALVPVVVDTHRHPALLRTVVRWWGVLLAFLVRLVGRA